MTADFTTFCKCGHPLPCPCEKVLRLEESSAHGELATAGAADMQRQLDEAIRWLVEVTKHTTEEIQCILPHRVAMKGK